MGAMWTVRHRVQPHHRVQIPAFAVPAQGVCKPAGWWTSAGRGIDITCSRDLQVEYLGYDAPRRPAPTSAPTWWPWSSASASIPIQRNLVFRSKGQPRQADRLVSGWPSASSPASSTPSTASGWLWLVCWCLISSTNIGTTVLNGGISMVIFFFVNKIIFPEGEAAKNNLSSSLFSSFFI